MKRPKLFLLILSLAALNASAQLIQFELVPPPPPAPQNIAAFEGVENGSIAFADGDGAIDRDGLITGENAFTDSISKLYTNDGSGNFTLVNRTPIDEVEDSSIAIRYGFSTSDFVKISNWTVTVL